MKSRSQRRKHIYSIELFVICLIVYSCHAPNIDSNKNIAGAGGPIFLSLEACLKSTLSITRISQIAELVEYVKLETNKQALIKDIIEVTPIKDGYLINDSRERLFKFDRNGRFCWKIDNLGKGPSEYLQLINFAIDLKRGKIFIPNQQNGVLIFDLNGKYSGSFHTDLNYARITIDKLDRLVLTTNSVQNNLVGIITDKNGVEISRLISRSKINMDGLDEVGRPIRFWSTRLNSYNCEPMITFHDTTWIINNYGKLQPFLVVDKSVASKPGVQYKHTVSRITKDLLCLSIGIENRDVILSIKTGKVFRIGDAVHKNLIDDIDSISSIRLFNAQDDHLIDALLPFDLVSEANQKNKALPGSTAFRNLKENDNPILRVYKLKTSISD